MQPDKIKGMLDARCLLPGEDNKRTAARTAKWSHTGIYTVYGRDT